MKFNTLDDVIDSIGVDLSYYLLEVEELLTFEQKNIGVEPINKLDYYNSLQTVKKILEDEKNNKDRKWSYRLFTKKKVSDNLINELQSMDKMDLIGWLS